MLLQEILKVKLSENTIESMRLFETTNKNEAIYRSLSVMLPKNKYARNWEQRLASEIHRNNNRPETSELLKSQHFGTELSYQRSTFLQIIDKESVYKKKYEKRPDVKRRLQKSTERLQEHKSYKEINKKQPEYRKGQLDPAPPLIFQPLQEEAS